MKTTNTIAVIVAIVLVVIAVGYFLTKSNSVTTPPAQTMTNQPSEQTQGIQNDSELTSAANELDSTDLNSIDSDLNQNDTDSSTF